MKRILSIVGCLALFACVLTFAAQRPTFSAPQEETKKLVDVKGDVMYPIKVADSSAICIVGNVAFYHNGTVITCDSAIRYSVNYMECFKNVMLNKDETYAYGDRADYNGRMNIANIYSPLIKVRNGESVLYTHNFKFNTRTNIGEYWGTGVVFDGDNVMESERGLFYADDNLMVCVEKVQLKNIDYRMISDSITYNTETDEARFYTRSYIWNNKDEILTAEQGVYNNQTKQYSFIDKAYIMTETREIWADTLYYYGVTEDVDMFGNIQIFDKEHSSYGFGHLGRYWNERGQTLLTRHPSVFTFDKNNDTTFMRADTMFLYVYYPSDFADSLSTQAPEERPVVDPYAHLHWLDSLSVDTRRSIADSLRGVLAVSKARMDSLVRIADSIELYANPVELERTLKLKARKDSIANAKIALRDSFYSLDEKGRFRFAAAYNKARKAQAKAAEKARLAAEKAKWEEEQARIKAKIEAQRAKDKAKEDSLKAAYKAELQAERLRLKAEKEAKKRQKTAQPMVDSTALDSLKIPTDSLKIVADSLSMSAVDSLKQQIDTLTVAPQVEPIPQMDSMSMSSAMERPDSVLVEQKVATPDTLAVRDTVSQQPVVKEPEPPQHITPPEVFALRRSVDSLRPRSDSLTRVETYIRKDLPVDSLALRADSLKKIQEREFARLDSLRNVDSLRYFNKAAYKRILKRQKEMEQARKQAIKDSLQAIKDSIREEKYIAKLKKRGVWVEPVDTLTTDSLDSLALTPIDSITVVQPVDSVATTEQADTIQRVIRGFHNAKIYKSNMQAITDSLAAFSKDSTIVMYKSPIIWNGLNQITSSQATFYTDGGESLRRGFFEGDPIMAAKVDDDHFNQVAGKTMTSFFRDNTVYRNDVNSNAQALYWMQEENSPDIIAYATLIAADITFLLANQTVTHINGYTNSEWTIYPPEKIPDDVPTMLDWFKWQIDLKPTREEVFDYTIRPTERKEYEGKAKPRFPISLRMNNKRIHLQKYYNWVDRNDVLTEQTLEWVNSVKQEYEQKK